MGQLSSLWRTSDKQHYILLSIDLTYIMDATASDLIRGFIHPVPKRGLYDLPCLPHLRLKHPRFCRTEAGKTAPRPSLMKLSISRRKVERSSCEGRATNARAVGAAEKVPTRRAIAASCPVAALIDLTTGRGMDTIAVSGWWRSTLDCFRCATISEAIMKAILSMALVLGVCGLAGAADDKAVDPVGTWKCEYEIGGQKRTSTLKIKKDGDKFAGTMSWPDQKETKLKDLKLKDGTLTFSAVRKLRDG